MRRQKRSELPASLLRLEERFTVWRKARSVGERIPKSLWKAAAKMAAEHGLNRTASVLKLEYYSLKRHVEQQSSDSNCEVAFVELPSTSTLPAGECLIEFQDGEGASIRIHLKGSEIPDVLALGRNFWLAE